jgi:hypothetical protein
MQVEVVIGVPTKKGRSWDIMTYIVCTGRNVLLFQEEGLPLEQEQYVRAYLLTYSMQQSPS